MFNWFSQIIAVTHVNLRSIPERIGAVLTAAVGIAGVVAVFVGVFSIAEGFRAALKVTGSPDIAIVLRDGADTEMTSGLGRDEARLIEDAPGIARGTNGPLASAELFVIINLPKRTTRTDANVPFRGVGQAAIAVRGDVKIIQGNPFQSGRNEVIVGVGAARAFAGLEVGNKIRIGQNDWDVVGMFSGGGGAAESEIWTDATVLQPAYHRGDSFQSVYVKLASPSTFNQFKDALTTNPQLKVKVIRQAEFLADQSTMLTNFIKSIGFFIAAMMALGAIFGALNTMYSAVSARTREIATLRALGFGTGPVVLSVLLESLAVALAGGAFGALAAYLAFNGFKTSTMNWQTFSQIAFAFTVTPPLLVGGVIWATLIGFIGGLFPAIRAARLPIAAALREL
jgi:putative ABC transport system permease protein